MNKLEALEAMQDGHSITHSNYTSEEYAYMTDGIIMTEDGYPKGTALDEFWAKIQKWETGWSIWVKPAQKETKEEATQDLQAIFDEATPLEQEACTYMFESYTSRNGPSTGKEFIKDVLIAHQLYLIGNIYVKAIVDAYIAGKGQPLTLAHADHHTKRPLTSLLKIPPGKQREKVLYQWVKDHTIGFNVYRTLSSYVDVDADSVTNNQKA